MVNRPNAAHAPSSGQGESVANRPVTGRPDITSMILPNSTGSANCAPAKQQIGDRQDPAEPRLLAEEFEHTGIETERWTCGLELETAKINRPI